MKHETPKPRTEKEMLSASLQELKPQVTPEDINKAVADNKCGLDQSTIRGYLNGETGLEKNMRKALVFLRKRVIMRENNLKTA